MTVVMHLHHARFIAMRCTSITVVQGFRNRDGQLIRRAGIVLDFNDGRHWYSADKGNFRKNVDPALVEFLHEETLLPINYTETNAGVPASDAGH